MTKVPLLLYLLQLQLLLLVIEHLISVFGNTKFDVFSVLDALFCCVNRSVWFDRPSRFILNGDCLSEFSVGLPAIDSLLSILFLESFFYLFLCFVLLQ